MLGKLRLQLARQHILCVVCVLEISEAVPHRPSTTISKTFSFNLVLICDLLNLIPVSHEIEVFSWVLT